MPDSIETPRDVVDCYYDFVSFCNNDIGYPISSAADFMRTELTDQWDKDCPGLQYPVIERSEEDGKYRLTNLSTPKERDRGESPL